MLHIITKFYYKVRKYLHKNNKNSLSFSTILMYIMPSYLLVSIVFWVYFREITDFLENKYYWFFITSYSIYLSILYWIHTKYIYNTKVYLFNFSILILSIFIYRNEELFPTEDVITYIFQIIILTTFIIVLIENDIKIISLYNKLQLYINKNILLKWNDNFLLYFSLLILFTTLIFLIRYISDVSYLILNYSMLYYQLFNTFHTYIYIILIFFFINLIFTLNIKIKFFYFIIYIMCLGGFFTYLKFDIIALLFLLTEFTLILFFFTIYNQIYLNLKINIKKFNKYINYTIILIILINLIFNNSEFIKLNFINWYLLQTQILNTDLFFIYYFLFYQFYPVLILITLILTFFSVFFIYFYFTFKNIKIKENKYKKNLSLLRKQNLIKQKNINIYINTFQK